MIGRKRKGINSNIETFPCMVGGLAPSSPYKKHWGLSPLARNKLRRCVAFTDLPTFHVSIPAIAVYSHMTISLLQEKYNYNMAVVIYRSDPKLLIISQRMHDCLAIMLDKCIRDMAVGLLHDRHFDLCLHPDQQKRICNMQNWSCLCISCVNIIIRFFRFLCIWLFVCMISVKTSAMRCQSLI